MPTIFPIPAFNDNYIWMIVNGQQAAVVDPGLAQPVIQALEADGLQLSAILITHHHHDHVGGVAKLKKATGARIYGPANSPFKGADIVVKEGEQVEVPGINMTFNIVATPGHTLDHICYLTEQLLFCGDTLFAGGCGRLFEGTPVQMYTSLQKLAGLNPSTQVYCAHEYTAANLKFAAACDPNNVALQKRIKECQQLRSNGRPTVPSSIELELATNPFLRCEQAGVQRMASEHARVEVTDPVAVFTVIRQWKDGFR